MKFNQKTQVKPYIDMNSKLGNKAKDDFVKEFCKLMNNSVFGKTMGNIQKHRDIKLVATESRQNYLVLEPNYYTKTFFTENVQALEMRKAQVLMNKPVYLGLPILDLSKTVCLSFSLVMCNRNMKKKLNYFFMDTDSFIVYIKTKGIYTAIANNVEAKFDASNYEFDRPFSKGKK